MHQLQKNTAAGWVLVFPLRVSGLENNKDTPDCLCCAWKPPKEESGVLQPWVLFQKIQISHIFAARSPFLYLTPSFPSGTEVPPFPLPLLLNVILQQFHVPSKSQFNSGHFRGPWYSSTVHSQHQCPAKTDTASLLKGSSKLPQHPFSHVFSVASRLPDGTAGKAGAFHRWVPWLHS